MQSSQLLQALHPAKGVTQSCRIRPAVHRQGSFLQSQWGSCLRPGGCLAVYTSKAICCLYYLLYKQAAALLSTVSTAARQLLLVRTRHVADSHALCVADVVRRKVKLAQLRREAAMHSEHDGSEVV